MDIDELESCVSGVYACVNLLRKKPRFRRQRDIGASLSMLGFLFESVEEWFELCDYGLLLFRNLLRRDRREGASHNNLFTLGRPGKGAQMQFPGGRKGILADVKLEKKIMTNSQVHGTSNYK